MTIYYSFTTLGFYNSEFHAELPADAVEITHDDHAALILAQAAGKIISGDINGYPVAIDPPPPSSSELISAQIRAIEATVTPRRMREATLGIDGGWLSEVDAQIAALRAELSQL